MAKFVIHGGKKLSGSVLISGNKNAVLPIMAATILTKGKCQLKNVPIIDDVVVMGRILEKLGARIKGMGTHELEIDTTKINKHKVDPELAKKLRAAILFLGPLLARFGKAKLRHPGGCIIGRRAVGAHFEALEKLGAKTITSAEDYESTVIKKRSAYIFLDEASVTATENAMMMASVIPGVTIIDDAACDPHIVDLALFLNSAGAKIEGAGTNRIRIDGVSDLHGASINIGPDYVDAGTFAIIAAVTKSKIKIENIRKEELTMILIYFKRMGLMVESANGSLTILPSTLNCPPGKIQTRPWPGFPTDLMSPFIVMATQAEGATLCHDWMYESRMFFVDKLITMGANITLCDPHRVLVSGPTRLKGKALLSPDIRAGMALVVAALCAEGESTIDNVEIIERGHEEIEKRLRALGADIRRVS